MRHTLAALFAVAALLCRAEDPAPDKPESCVEEFQKQWVTITSRMRKKDIRTFQYKGTSPEGVEIRSEIVLTVTDVVDGKPRFSKVNRIENKAELAEKEASLPDIVAGDTWFEPFPLLYADDAVFTLEKDVELKVGESKVTCWKLSVVREGMTASFWITPDEDLGLVRVQATKQNKPVADAVLTSFNRETK